MISNDSVWCAIVDGFGQVQTLFAGLGCYHAKGLIDQVLDAERLVLQLYLVLLSPGVVQNIVDDGQESLAAFPDAFDVLLLHWS